MASKLIQINKDGCPLSSCKIGTFSLEVGEEVKITLNGKNPDWPAFIVGEVVAVDPYTKGSGWSYTVDIEEDDLNGGPMFEDCDIEVACYSCCDKNAEDIAALQACVFNSTLITFVPPVTSYEILVDYEGFPSGFGYLLENGDATSEFTIPLGPNGEAIVSYTVVSPAAGTFTETPTCVPATDTFVTLTDEGNGTASTKNADGTDGPCLVTCPPAGTPAGAVPSTDEDGNVTWAVPVPDTNTTYTYSGNGIFVPSDGGPNLDASDLLDDTVIDTSATYEVINGVLTIPTVDAAGNPTGNSLTVNIPDKFGTNTDNGNGTNSNTDGNGLTVCNVACPPDGTPAGAVPSTDADGNITWAVPEEFVLDLNFELTRIGDDLFFEVLDNNQAGGSINGANDYTVTIEDVFTDNDTQDISAFSGVVAGGIVTLTHTAGGVTTPVQFPLGVSSLITVSNPDGSTTITYVDGAGVTQTAGVIPAAPVDDDSGNVTESAPDADGVITYTHVPSGVTWTVTPPTVDTIDVSTISPFVANATAQVHSAGGVTTPIGLFDNANTNLGASTTAAGLEELATINRAWAGINQSQRTNDLPQQLNERLRHENSVSVNVDAATQLAHATAGYSFSVGDLSATRDDMLIQNGRLDHNTIAEGYAKTAFEMVVQGENGDGNWVLGPNGIDTHIVFAQQDLDEPQGSRFGMSTFTLRRPSERNKTWGVPLGTDFNFNQVTAHRYDGTVEMLTDPGFRFYERPIVASVDNSDLYSDQHWYARTHGSVHVLGRVAADIGSLGNIDIKEGAWAAPTNPTFQWQFMHNYTGPAGGPYTSGADYDAGGFVASNNSPFSGGTPTIITKVTPHNPKIAEFLQDIGLLSEKLDPEVVRVNYSYYPMLKTIEVDEGDWHLTIDVFNSKWVATSRSTGEEKAGEDDRFKGCRSVLKIDPLGDSDEVWNMTAEERFDYDQKKVVAYVEESKKAYEAYLALTDEEKAKVIEDNDGIEPSAPEEYSKVALLSPYRTHTVKLENSQGEKKEFAITDEDLPEELKGLASYTVKVNSTGVSDNDETLVVGEKTVNGLPSEATLYRVKSLKGYSVTGATGGGDSGESYTLTISK